MAPAPIENKLLEHNDVEMACVSGSGQPSPYGMVVLSERARAAVSGTTEREKMATELDSLRRQVNAQLDHHEQLKMLVVIGEEWTIDNGKLTPTMKLKRGAIEKESAPHVEGWYGASEDVIWHG